MLSGVKFIPRDQIDSEKGGSVKSSSKKEKSRRTEKSSRYDGSSDDERLEKIKKGSGKKKWYSSDEGSGSSSENDDERKRKSSKRDTCKSKKSKKSKKEYSSEEFSSSGSEDDRSGTRKRKSKGRGKESRDDDSGGEGGPSSGNNIDIVRKEMGLDWMLRPSDRHKKTTGEEQPVEISNEEQQKVNPKEMNPYWKDNGVGYPEEEAQPKASHKELLPSSLVGDGGASWRLKALKRAKEQAAREGRDLKEVVQDRWGDLGHLAVAVSSRRAAPPRAHLHAINSRKVGGKDGIDSDSKSHNEKDTEKVTGREYLKDVSVRHPEMKAPRACDSLSWGRKKGANMDTKDAALISSAISSINKFANDGNFMSQMIIENNEIDGRDNGVAKCEETVVAGSSSTMQESGVRMQPLSANQIAAKALQLRLKGKHEEADRLMKEAQHTKVDQTHQSAGERITKLRNDVTTSRYAAQEKKLQQKNKEDDSDIYLAQSIMTNKKYSTSNQAADDEYEYDGAPNKKSRRKTADRGNRSEAGKITGKRIVTQQERCVFCFENQQRPKHLVVAIANFTYLMLPQFTPVTPGHCCIVTLQHELATRMVDDNVWEEIRNFKKCLIMMFAKQQKEVIFLETVLWLSQQRRHCLIECIPLPQDIAKDGPLYFKKAIDEAESEWSQHNAKKLIDTSQKGLRASIPKDFPYVHVEFGLKKGFVHVIDDETQFKSSFGLNVIRGMLQSQDEDMYRRRRYDAIEVQKQAVAEFAKDWGPVDWTKQLD